MSFSEILAAAAHEYGIALGEAELNAFSTYNDLLLTWNEKINLTTIVEPGEVAVKHIIDSLSCYDAELFPIGCRVVDVGTGAGFPGLPLKIIRPDIELTLLDSLNKRLLFLQEVVDALQLQGVSFLHARAEDAGRSKDQRDGYHVALSRAVARLNVLCELCLPLVRSGGCFIALKGAQFKDEMEEAHRALKVIGGQIASVRTVKLPGIVDQRAVIYIRKTTSTPAAYPRRAGLPEKKPL
ncbi:MAG: 16S rRNA (guanine(527)-N(7))-methyltransferase RsmG [Negativicutes bacterium]|nr:16S rRNA (guanine(527)-N(7))-methyltransferase RsmG [Negativicutes bacterium]